MLRHHVYCNLLDSAPHCERLLCVTCRVKAKSGKTPDDIANVVKSLPPGLISSYNTGKADFYPSTSGKQNAAQHIVDKFGSSLEEAFLLCDDDNDMGEHINLEECVFALW